MEHSGEAGTPARRPERAPRTPSELTQGAGTHAGPNAAAAVAAGGLPPALLDRLLDGVERRLPPNLLELWQPFRQQYASRLVQLELRHLHAPWARVVQQHTGVNAAVVSLGAGAVGLFVFRYLFQKAASLVVNVVGFLYPAYQSLKALETQAPEDDRQWLTYWTVFAFLTCAEHYSDLLLRVLPFYYVIKLAFLVWSFHPATRGAQLVHARLLRPLLLRYGPSIDREVARRAQEARDAAVFSARKLAASATGAGDDSLSTPTSNDDKSD